MDERTLREMWGVLAVRGTLYTLFGIVTVFWPHLTIATFVYLFAALILGSGLISLVMSLVNADKKGSFFSRLIGIFLGIIEIGLGVYLFRHPLVSFTTLIVLIGLVLIVRGVLDCVAGLFGDGSGMQKTVMIVGGILATVVGVIMFFQPQSSGIAFVWILGIYALITGPLLLALAFNAKNGADKLAAA